MADIFFFEQGADPRPPDEVRIEELQAAPYPDGRRVKLKLVVTPFIERPNLDVEVFNSAGESVATVDILETMTTAVELTVHLRSPRPEGEHTLRARLYYEEMPDQDTREVVFTVTPPEFDTS